jgi:hypothetical protein
MWEDVSKDGVRWRKRRWNTSFEAWYQVEPSSHGYRYHVIELPTCTVLLGGFASGLGPERLERVLENDLRTVSARDTAEVPSPP